MQELISFLTRLRNSLITRLKDNRGYLGGGALRNHTHSSSSDGGSSLSSATVIASLIGGAIAAGTLAVTGITTSTLTANGVAVFNSSATASAFFGDGSHLTGITGGGGITNTVSSFTITGAGLLMASGSSITLSSSGGLYLSTSSVSTVPGLTLTPSNQLQAQLGNSISSATVGFGNAWYVSSSTLAGLSQATTTVNNLDSSFSTATIPANFFATNGTCLEYNFVVKCAADTQLKTFRVRLGTSAGTGGTLIASAQASASNQTGAIIFGQVCRQGVGQQIFWEYSLGGNLANSGTNTGTGSGSTSFDETQVLFLSFTMQSGANNVGEVSFLQSVVKPVPF